MAEEDFNLIDAAKEVTSDESTGSGELNADETQSTGEGGQAEGTPTTTEAGKELSAQEILTNIGQEKETSEASPEFLEQINGLGAIHKGVPITINDQAQLTELIQKGFDYTQKTMSHAEEIKTKQEEFTQLEAKFEVRTKELDERELGLAEVTNENQIVESVLSKLKVNDPDLFQEFADLYNQEAQAFNAQKPYQAQFDNQIKQLNEVVNGLKSSGHEKELAGVREGWDKELGETQTKYAASLAKLGVKIDWDKVKTAWGNNSDNSLSVEGALFAAHGKEIQAANVSHQKVLATKAKTQNTLLKRNGIGGGQGSAEGDLQINQVGNYENLLQLASTDM